ncbi:MAG: TetR/AcrR family transcriptional regulator [Rhizobiaceae bacterium]
MARPREFDIEQAREDAMNVFWDGGYKGTSLPDLLDSLGLSRGSLYKAFDSKRSLFVEALLLYDKTVLQPGVALLKDGRIISGESRIEKFFDYAVDRAEAGDRRGCLLCNAAVGAAHDDREIGTIVARMFKELTSGIEVALQDTSKFSTATDEERVAKANGITMIYVGLRVLVRSGAEITQLRNSVNGMLSEL